MTAEKKTSFKERVKADFTTVAWVLIPIGIAINLVGRFIIQILNLPLFLDTIGTVLVAFLSGPFVAAITGLLTNFVIGLTMNPTSFPFALVNAAIGLVAGGLAARGYLKTFPKAVILTLALTVTTIVIASPIVVFVFGGVQGTGADAVTGFFMATGRQMIQSVVGSQLIVQPLDKVITVLLSFFLVKGVPNRYRPPFAQRAMPFNK